MRLKKCNFIVLLATLLMQGGVLYAADSTGVKLLSAAPNQPFTVDSGYWDTQSVNSPATFLTNANKLCPANFQPFLTATPFKSSTSLTGSTFACPVSITPSGTQYAVQMNFSTSRNAASVYLGDVGINWSMQCYPQGTAPANIPSCSVSPRQPLLLDAGTVYLPTFSNNYAYWFEIWKQCPANYTPYATFQLSDIGVWDAGTTLYIAKIAPIGRGACNFSQGGGAPPETGVEFNARFSESPPAKTYGGSMSVSYQVYCYPAGATLPYWTVSAFDPGPESSNWFDVGNNAGPGPTHGPPAWCN